MGIALILAGISVGNRVRTPRAGGVPSPSLIRFELADPCEAVYN